MTRIEFIAVTAVILFVAFSLGWAASWLFHRLTRVTQADMGELESMAQALHEAEEQRDEALEQADRIERDLASRLHQAQAELRAAMEGLREARTEAEELRMRIERQGGGH